MQNSYAFSPLDEIMPPLWMTLILCFPCPDSRRIHVALILQRALSRMTREKPYVAGTLQQTANTRSGSKSDGPRPGSLSLQIPDRPGEAVELVINDISQPDSGWEGSYEDLRAAGMPLSKLDGAILSPVPYGVTSTSNRVFEAKLTFIPGGCLLSVSTSHAFVDAWGFIVLMEAWARHCREIQAESAATPNSAVSDSSSTAGSAPNSTKTAAGLSSNASRPPALFADVVRATGDEYDKLQSRPELWQLLGLDWRHLETGSRAPQPFHHPAAVRTCMFTVSPAGMARIKEMATPEPSDTSSSGDAGKPRWVSTKDALVAYLWRSILRARVGSWKQDDGAADGESQQPAQSMVSVAIDGRRALSPPISTAYIGNVVFCCLTWAPVEWLVAPTTPLAAVAQALRASIEQKARSPALLADAVRLAASVPDVTGGTLGNAFTSWYGRDLVTTSVVDLPIYSLDFGPLFGRDGSAWGHPEFFRMPKGQFDGICMIQPKQRDGMVDVILSLEPDQMERLIKDEDFSRRFAFLSE